MAWLCSHFREEIRKLIFFHGFHQPHRLHADLDNPLSVFAPQRRVLCQIEYITGKGREDVVWECSKADFLINVTNPSMVQTPSKLIDYGIAGRPVLDVTNDFSDASAFLKFYEGDYSGERKVDFLDNYRIENVARRFVELEK